MPDFPKINDKFYSVGQRCGSLRRAVETIQQINETAERTPPETRPDWRAVESNSFSVMVGFFDGIIARIR